MSGRLLTGEEVAELVAFEIDEHQVLDLDLWSALVRLRAEYTCEECGAMQPSFLHRRGRGGRWVRRVVAHHIGDDRHLGNHMLANGKALCGSCHTKTHVALRKYGA